MVHRYPWVAGACVLSVIVLLGVCTGTVSQRHAASRDSSFKYAGYFRLIDKNGKPPQVSDVSAFDMGVKPSINSDGQSHASSLTSFVPRSSVEDRLNQALSLGGFVLLHGPAAAGKSRMGYEAVRANFPTHTLLLPANGHALAHLVRAGVRLRNTVVWLDDLERYVTAGGLDSAVLDGLCPRNRSDVVVVATIRDGELQRIEAAANWTASQSASESINRIPSPLLLADDMRSISLRIDLTEAERDAARKVDDPRILEALRHPDVGFAEYLAAGPAMMRRWAHGDGAEFQVGAAVLSAAVDCRRAGYLAPVPRDLLQRLHGQYLAPNWRRHADLPEVSQGLQWACQPVLGASSCLTPGVDDTYLAADYLVDQTEAGVGPIATKAVPRLVWTSLLEIADPGSAHRLGLAALATGKRDVARTAFQTAADAGLVEAMFSLGILFSEDGQLSRAERSYRVAADSGYLPAMNNLGNIVKNRGDLASAERLYTAAASAGDPKAMANLGRLYEKGGNASAAERWYKRAVDHGQTAAAGNLASLCERQGRSDDALRWYSVAADSGDSHAMYHLGRLLQQRQETTRAIDWYQRAADKGESVAKHDLAVLIERSGDSQRAETLFRELAASGHSDGMAHLANILNKRGDTSDAAHWYEKAVRAGRTGEMYNLAVVLMDLDRFDEAESWFRRAIRKGSAEAAQGLGMLLLRQGKDAQAQRWFRQAAKDGQATSMHNLGVAAVEHGDMRAAERWFRQSADAGEKKSFNNLALILKQRGNVEEAERWYRLACADGGVNSLIITVFGEEEQPGNGFQHALELVDRAAVAAAFPAEHP